MERARCLVGKLWLGGMGKEGLSGVVCGSREGEGVGWSGVAVRVGGSGVSRRCAGQECHDSRQKVTAVQKLEWRHEVGWSR